MYSHSTCIHVFMIINVYMIYKDISYITVTVERKWSSIYRNRRFPHTTGGVPLNEKSMVDMVSSELLTYLILQYTIDKVDAQIVIKWTPLSESVWLVACGFYTYVLYNFIHVCTVSPAKFQGPPSFQAWKVHCRGVGIARCQKGHGRVDHGVHHGTQQDDLLEPSPAREEDEEEPGD